MKSCSKLNLFENYIFISKSLVLQKLQKYVYPLVLLFENHPHFITLRKITSLYPFQANVKTVVCRCWTKLVLLKIPLLLKIPQVSQENTCVGVLSESQQLY